MSEAAWISILESPPVEVGWSSIDEGGEIVFLDEAAVAPPPSIPAAPREIVLRGVLAIEDRARRVRRRGVAIGAIVLALRKAFAWSVSAFAHLLAMILFVGMILYSREEDSDVVSISLAPIGPREETRQVQGKQGEHEEQPETVPAPVPEPVEPKPPQPDPAPVERPAVAAPAASTPPAPATPVSGEKILSGRGGATRGEMLKRFGGNEASENAVEKGLRWLAAHQHPAGGWDANAFYARCPPDDRCNDPNSPGDPSYSVGVTSLALLAFLGSGYRPDVGEHSETIAGALRYLMAMQHGNGGFTSAGQVNFYNHALATWALCETFAITRQDLYRVPAQQAVDYLVGHQEEGGGWDYYPDGPGRNDASITGWAVMALKSAQIGRLKVPEGALSRVRKLIEQRTDGRTGELVYAERPPGTGRKGDGLVAVGMLCRIYLGMKEPGPLKGGAARLLQNLPSWTKLKEAEAQAARLNRLPTDHNMYYWYYGTLAMFQMGGDYWPRWNREMRDLLVRHQRTEGHRDGSWDPEVNHLGREGGRVWATAVNVLNLEIYYRYLPLYLLREDIAQRNAWELKKELLDQARANVSQGEVLQAMNDLAKLKGDPEAIAAIAEKLAHPDSMVRWNASKLLSEMGARTALPKMMEAAAKEPTAVKGAMLEHLARFKDRSVAPLLIKCLSDENPRVADGARNALRVLSGEDFGTDARAWEEWHSRQK